MRQCWWKHFTPSVEMVTRIVSNCMFPYSSDDLPVMDNEQDITIFHQFGLYPWLSYWSVPWERVYERAK